jgi:hypothetical protein
MVFLLFDPGYFIIVTATSNILFFALYVVLGHQVSGYLSDYKISWCCPVLLVVSTSFCTS